MPGTTRTFVAIELPPAVREALAALQARLADDAPGVRPVGPEALHLTLAFLGDVPDADLAGVCRAVAEAARPSGPFAIELLGLGVFPGPSKPRALWAGVTGPGVEPLMDLQRGLVQGLRDAGHPPDDKGFHPHVTLGRFRPGGGPSPDLTRLIARSTGESFGEVMVRQVVAFASTLKPDGPEYMPLARAPLKGRKGGGRT